MTQTEPDQVPDTAARRQGDAMRDARDVFVVLAICFALVGLATLSLLDREAGAAMKADGGRRATAAATIPDRAGHSAMRDRPCSEDAQRDPAPQIPPDP